MFAHSRDPIRGRRSPPSRALSGIAPSPSCAATCGGWRVGVSLPALREVTPAEFEAYLAALRALRETGEEWRVSGAVEPVGRRPRSRQGRGPPSHSAAAAHHPNLCDRRLLNLRRRSARPRHPRRLTRCGLRDDMPRRSFPGKGPPPLFPLVAVCFSHLPILDSRSRPCGFVPSARSCRAALERRRCDGSAPRPLSATLRGVTCDAGPSHGIAGSSSGTIRRTRTDRRNLLGAVVLRQTRVEPLRQRGAMGPLRPWKAPLALRLERQPSGAERPGRLRK